jgi:protein-tyrosine phosphatase
MEASAPTGFIDIHTHLIPGVDDGCATVAESIECARALAAAGFMHVFCTPHIWPNLINNTVDHIRQWTEGLQKRLDEAGVPLKLYPGGEISLNASIATTTPPEQLVTCALNRKYVLADFWADRLPSFFEPTVKWVQSLGLTLILAHPERVRAVQVQPNLADEFAQMGVLLQGNLQCLVDPPGTPTRDTIERFLTERRYFALATDMHGPSTIPNRVEGLNRARSILDEREIRALLCVYPSALLP